MKPLPDLERPIYSAIGQFLGQPHTPRPMTLVLMNLPLSWPPPDDDEET